MADTASGRLRAYCERPVRRELERRSREVLETMTGIETAVYDVLDDLVEDQVWWAVREALPIQESRWRRMLRGAAKVVA